MEGAEIVSQSHNHERPRERREREREVVVQPRPWPSLFTPQLTETETRLSLSLSQSQTTQSIINQLKSIEIVSTITGKERRTNAKDAEEIEEIEKGTLGPSINSFSLPLPIPAPLNPHRHVEDDRHSPTRRARGVDGGRDPPRRARRPTRGREAGEQSLLALHVPRGARSEE